MGIPGDLRADLTGRRDFMKEKQALQNDRKKMRRNGISTQKIGRLGELLVQFELLQHGIDSAPMTTDSGVDLVAYSELRGRPYTIQVKTCLKPKPAGGKGAAAIDWRIEETCPAELLALTEISTHRVWLFTKKDLVRKAQQSCKGILHIYMYTDPSAGSRGYGHSGDQLFSEFLLENRIGAIFL
jgi:hypothetical protein